MNNEEQAHYWLSLFDLFIFGVFLLTQVLLDIIYTRLKAHIWKVETKYNKISGMQQKQY